MHALNITIITEPSIRNLVWWPTVCNPSTWKMRQEDCHKLEASFDSTVSSRVAWLLYETLPQKTQGGGGGCVGAWAREMASC